MNIFTQLLLMACVLFGIHKIVYKIFFRRPTKKSEHVRTASKTLKNDRVDLQHYSTLSFNFPNIQSETEMKILNSGPDLDKKRGEIKVKQYCKY